MKKTTKIRIATPIVRITNSYQVTIPYHIRKVLDLNAGDYVEVSLDMNDRAILKPVEVVVKKSKKNDIDWKQEGEKNFFTQYNEKDSAYDNFEL